MTLEQLVTDLATSQRLRDAGFPQDTAFSWFPADSPDDAETVRQDLGEEFIKRDVFVFQSGECDDALCAAPTAGELMEWFKNRFSFLKAEFRQDKTHEWRRWKTPDGEHWADGETDVVTLAALVLEMAG